MQTAEPTPAEKRILKLSYQEQSEIWLSRQNTLRQLIGYLGISLPLLLWFFLLIDMGVTKPLPSLSHYYYTRVSGIFVIIVSLMAIFLLIYKGGDKLDFYVSSIAGIAALVVVLFPTDNLSLICNDDFSNYAVTILKPGIFRVKLHYIAAGIFLSCLAFMAFFLFTRINPNLVLSREKRLRNMLYRSSAVVMVLAMMVMLAGALNVIPAEYYLEHQFTFWMETVAIVAFGFSWLVKGKAFFDDKHHGISS